MLPLTSTHHFHFRGHSALAHFCDESLVIDVTAPGEIVTDLEIVLHGLGTEKARAFARSIINACERIEPAAPLEPGLADAEMIAETLERR